MRASSLREAVSAISASTAPVADAASPENAYTFVPADACSYGDQTAEWGDPHDGGTYRDGAFDRSADAVAVRDAGSQVTSTGHENGSWTGGGCAGCKAGRTITYGIVVFGAEGFGAMG